MQSTLDRNIGNRRSRGMDRMDWKTNREEYVEGTTRVNLEAKGRKGKKKREEREKKAKVITSVGANKDQQKLEIPCCIPSEMETILCLKHERKEERKEGSTVRWIVSSFPFVQASSSRVLRYVLLSNLLYHRGRFCNTR